MSPNNLPLPRQLRSPAGTGSAGPQCLPQSVPVVVQPAGVRRDSGVDIGVTDVAEHCSCPQQVRRHQADAGGQVTGVHPGDPDVGQTHRDGLGGRGVALVGLEQRGAYALSMSAGGENAEQVVALPGTGTDGRQRLALTVVQPPEICRRTSRSRRDSAELVRTRLVPALPVQGARHPHDSARQRGSAGDGGGGRSRLGR